MQKLIRNLFKQFSIININENVYTVYFLLLQKRKRKFTVLKVLSICLGLIVT